MSLITAENAAEYGRRSAIARAAAKREREQQRLNPPPVIVAPNQEASVERTKAQVAKLDADLDAALDKHDYAKAAIIAGIKSKLWPLATPVAGTMKPPHPHREVMRQL